MLTDCADPREVADFHFLQLRTLRITKENENIPAKSVNILASTSKYGLLFVGIEGGFKVIKLEDVLTLDEDKENRSIVQKYSYSLVPCGTPIFLAANCTQTTLAVCVKSAMCILINLYNLPVLLNSDPAVWKPFSSNTLSPNLELRDFSWNPTLEGLYAFCLSDGSLHLHEVNENGIKPVASLPNGNTISVCWSPKGKQLVAGKANGFFSQYKQTLQEAKTVAPPQLEEGPIAVTSICWISTTVFAVLYVTGDSPNFFIVSTPKDSPVVYTNFNDVCLGNNNSPDQRYLLHLEPSWGILICASLDSIEIAVLGDMPNWVQWDLKEDGKALLPGKDGALHAVGMAVMYSAQAQIIISESESYPPMPVMFLLTNNGLLVSFHMINSKPEAVSLVSPPMPIEMKSATASVNTASAPGTSGPAISSTNKDFSSEDIQWIQNVIPGMPVVSSAFIAENAPAVSQTPVSQNNTPERVNLTTSVGGVRNSAFSQVDQHKESLHSFGNETLLNTLSMNPEGMGLNSAQRAQEKNYTSRNTTFSATENQNEDQSSTDKSYRMAIIHEIQNFTKELQDLKQLQNSAPTIDREEDMIHLKIFASNLHNFQKDISETMQSISSDIYTLKNVLLESFVMVEEACSRERRKNDHSYITMLKERALDPITAKRMRKMNQHYQYLRTQLQEVCDRLDQERINLVSNKKKSVRSNPCISSTEAIYKTIVNNQNIIHNLKKKVDVLLEKAKEKKLRNTTKSSMWGKHYRRSSQEDLSKLADEFLDVKISHPEDREQSAIDKKLSTESQNFLKDFLKKSSVVTVRPTAVYSPSQSRLLSNSLPSEDFAGCNQKKSPPTREVLTAASSPSKSPAPETASMVTQLKSTSASERGFEPYTPVVEPVTPPDTTYVLPSINKTFTTSTALVTPLSKEKHPKDGFQAFSTILSSPAVQKESANRGYNSAVTTDNECDKELPGIFTSAGAKLPTFSHASSDISSSASPIFPRTISFSSSIQARPECTISKPSFSVANSSVSHSENKTILVSSSSVTSVPESKSLIASGSSPVSSQGIPFVPSCISISVVSSSQSTNFIPSVPVTSQISTSSLLATPVTKNSTAFNIPPTVPLFQKSSNSFDQSTLSEKDESLLASGRSPNANINVSLDNKSSVDSKSPNRQEHRVEGGKSISGSFASLIEAASLGAEDKPNSQPSTGSLPDLKHSDTQSSNTLVCKPSVSFPSIGIAQQPVSVISSTPSVATVTSFTSQPDPSISKSSTAPSVPFTSEPTSTNSLMSLFGQNVTICSPVTSENNSDALKKTESSVTPAFGIKTTLFEKSLPETSFFSTTTTSTTTTATTNASAFGQTTPVTQAASAFGQTTPVTQAASTFGQTTPVTQTAPKFGQTTPVTQIVSTFGQTTPVTQAASTFGQTTPVTQTGAAFGQTPVTQTASPFGQLSNFAPTSEGFFSQAPVFGSPATTTAAVTSPDANNQTPAFSFGKPVFGNTTGSFGLAKSFGQNPTPVTQSGTSSSFSFAQNSNLPFGQGSFFSGLGGKPSEENASKNVFGLSSAVKPADTSNLFRNSGVTSFGSANSGGSFAGTGTFSSGGGGVAQSGFGAFQQSAVQQQQQPPQQQPVGFGAAPAFGSTPAFGSPPAFGSTPTFGSGNALSSVFGQQQVSSNFSSFANASSPTFGSLASQGGGFSSPPVANSGSGDGGFGSPSFGSLSFGNQPSGFGSPSSPPSNSSAFTQWRN